MMKLSFKKTKIIKDKKYLMWICEKPCYPCQINNRLNYYQIQAHHLQGRHRIGALIRRDNVVVPCCFTCHQELTFKVGERNFWDNLGIDPIHYANELWQEWSERNDNKTEQGRTSSS